MLKSGTDYAGANGVRRDVLMVVVNDVSTSRRFVNRVGLTWLRGWRGRWRGAENVYIHLNFLEGWTKGYSSCGGSGGALRERNDTLFDNSDGG